MYLNFACLSKEIKLSKNNEHKYDFHVSFYQVDTEDVNFLCFI